MKNILVLTALLGVFAGCRTKTTYVDTNNDQREVAAGLDYRDLERATDQIIGSIRNTGRFNRADGGVYVLAIGRVVNDTQQRAFDVDILTSHITEKLMEDGTFLITSAVAARASNRDEMLDANAAIRGDAEFNQETVAAAGQRVAPTHSLKGKIIQREPRLTSGDKQVEFWVQFQITEIATGLQWWQKQAKIIKNMDSDAMSF